MVLTTRTYTIFTHTTTHNGIHHSNRPPEAVVGGGAHTHTHTKTHAHILTTTRTHIQYSKRPHDVVVGTKKTQ